MSKKISTLPPGAIVKLNENGVPTKYLFLEYNHYGKEEVTLLRKDCTRCAGWNYYTSVNSYKNSIIDDYCNITHIQTFDSIIQSCLINVPVPAERGGVAGESNSTEWDTTDILHRKGFTLSAREVGFRNNSYYDSTYPGVWFRYFASDANRVAYYEADQKPKAWFLRDTRRHYSRDVQVVDTTGRSVERDIYYNAFTRPAIAISSEILVSDNPDMEGAYTVEDAVIAGEQYMKVNGVWKRMC